MAAPVPYFSTTRVDDNGVRRRYTMTETSLGIEWWDDNMVHHLAAIPYDSIDMIALLNEGRL